MRENPNTGSLLMALIIAVLAFIGGYCLKVRETQQEIIRHDTVIVQHWDTTIIERPTEIVRYITRFDTIECLQTEKIITNTIEKQRRIGFGIQAGIGYSGKITPYVGVGIQYRLW